MPLSSSKSKSRGGVLECALGVPDEPRTLAVVNLTRRRDAPRAWDRAPVLPRKGARSFLDGAGPTPSQPVLAIGGADAQRNRHVPIRRPGKPPTIVVEDDVK